MKSLNSTFLVASIIILAVFLAAIFSLYRKPEPTTAAIFNSQGFTVPTIASSTVFALTGGATGKNIVGTSSASITDPAQGGRVALTLQTHHCTNTATVYLGFNDVAAATSTFFYLSGSTTVTFGDSVPMVHGSIRAMTSGTVAATCSLIVTEWRSENF